MSSITSRTFQQEKKTNQSLYTRNYVCHHDLIQNDDDLYNLVPLFITYVSAERYHQ
jgi:hypothetical protein